MIHSNSSPLPWEEFGSMWRAGGLLWAGVLAAGFLSLRHFFALEVWRETWRVLAPSSLPAREISYVRVEQCFAQGVSLLRAGLVLSESYWKELDQLPFPWGKVVPAFLKGLRAEGARVLPTLQRLEDLARKDREARNDGRARVAPALAQAWVGLAMVGGCGVALPFLLDEVLVRPWSWAAVCGVSLFLGMLALVWIQSLASSVVNLGLRGVERSLILWAPLAGEMLLATLRSGCPPDLAWNRMHQELMTGAPLLAEGWGVSLWDHQRGEFSRRAGVWSVFYQLGSEMRAALMVSLMEGRSSGDSIESALQRFRFELQVETDKGLRLLSHRALVPLFALNLPAVLLMLGYAFYTVWLESV